MIKLSSLFLITSSLVCPLIPFVTQANDLCGNRGYTIGFFNGVWNSRNDAQNGLDALQEVFFGNHYKTERLKYELFYNNTEGKLLDVIEVFAQRSGTPEEITKRTELLWEVAYGNPDAEGSLFHTMITAMPDGPQKT